VSRADVSLIIPCRNDRDNVRRLVTEARPWVREIVVVDTMSDDGSPEVAKEAGADIVSLRPDLIHEDGLLRSFAEVHNEAYALATRPWRLWLHTDDTLDAGWQHVLNIVEEAEKRREGEPCFSIWMWYDYTWCEGRCIQTLKHPRFIHRDHGWRWNNPIHESIACCHGDIHTCPHQVSDQVRVRHLSGGGRNAHNDRNLRMLQRWERDGCKPGEDQVVLKFHLGDELFVRQQFAEAFAYFNQVARLGTNLEIMAALRAARSLMLQGKYQETWEYVKPLMHQRPDIANFYWDLAWMSLFKLGDVSQARRAAKVGQQAPLWIEGETTKPRDAVLSQLQLLTAEASGQ